MLIVNAPQDAQFHEHIRHLCKIVDHTESSYLPYEVNGPGSNNWQLDSMNNWRLNTRADGGWAITYRYKPDSVLKEFERLKSYLESQGFKTEMR